MLRNFAAHPQKYNIAICWQMNVVTADTNTINTIEDVTQMLITMFPVARDELLYTELYRLHDTLNKSLKYEGFSTLVKNSHIL
jgi:adenosine/AMP kinase